MMASPNAYDQLLSEARQLWRRQSGQSSVGAAQTLLVRAVATDPGRPEAFLLLAELMVASGRSARAEQYYESAVAVAPESLEVRRRLLAYYLDHGQGYAALALADGVLSPEAIEHLRTVYPTRSTTLAITLLGQGPALAPTLAAIAGQSYPISELLVVSDGADPDALAEAEAAGARALVQPGLTLGQARLWMLAEARGDMLAYVDRAVAPSRHWLARLMVHLDLRHHYHGDPPWLCRDAGAATGHLAEAHQRRLADRWRKHHLLEHYMGGWGPAVLWMFSGAGLYLRQTALDLALAAPLPDDLPDAELADRLRQTGWRVAYDEYALCLRHSPASLPALWREVRSHSTPYYQSDRLICYGGGGLADAARAVADRVKRGRIEEEVDRYEQCFSELALLTLLVGPTLVLDDLAHAARSGGPVASQTHAAAYLALFALLGELGIERDLIETLCLLTKDFRPADPELAGLCEWPGVEAVLDLPHGGSFNPFEFLPRRDGALANAFVRELGQMLATWQPADWQAVRGSALLLAAEADPGNSSAKASLDRVKQLSAQAGNLGMELKKGYDEQLHKER